MIAQINAKTERVIEELVASGGYEDESDVIEQAVLLLQRRLRDQRFIQSVREASEAAHRGETIPYSDDLMDRIWEEAIEADRLGLPINPDVCP